MERNPDIDADRIEELITPKTRVIVPVHYAGVACDMDKIIALADKYGLLVVEDAAQAISGRAHGTHQKAKRPGHPRCLPLPQLAQQPLLSGQARWQGTQAVR